MTHTEMFNRIAADMRARGLPAGTAVPPVWKLLWRLGIRMPPPLFLGFWSNALLLGVIFGALWGMVMWLLIWSAQGMPVAWALSGALLAAVLFGVTMAAVMRYFARRHALPSWADYQRELGIR
jgi:hypothetical protein